MRALEVRVLPSAFIIKNQGHGQAMSHDCHECEMHHLCIPVPGMPGKCAMPVECEQCIGDRMDAVEAESKKLDTDIAAMRRDIDDLGIQIRAQGKRIARQTRQIRDINAATAKEIENARSMLDRSVAMASKFPELDAKIRELNEMLKSINAEVS